MIVVQFRLKGAMERTRRKKSPFLEMFHDDDAEVFAYLKSSIFAVVCECATAMKDKYVAGDEKNIGDRLCRSAREKSENLPQSEF